MQLGHVVAEERRGGVVADLITVAHASPTAWSLMALACFHVNLRNERAKHSRIWTESGPTPVLREVS